MGNPDKTHCSGCGEERYKHLMVSFPAFDLCSECIRAAAKIINASIQRSQTVIDVECEDITVDRLPE